MPEFNKGMEEFADGVHKNLEKSGHSHNLGQSMSFAFKHSTFF